MLRHTDVVAQCGPQPPDEAISERYESRQANVTRDEDGAVGVPVFFSAEELERQGVDLSETDQITVRVRDGFVVIESFED